jgi:RNA polymerase sigma-70 factor (ECF subfamily)
MVEKTEPAGAGKERGVASDEDLMLSYQRGDRDALDALVERYLTPVYRYLLRLVAQPELAKDLTQDCFVRLVRCGRLYQYPRPFRPWLYTIATNTLRRHLESAYHRHPSVPYEQDDRLAAVAETPHLLIGAWADRDTLQVALGLLSPDHREVITLRYTEDFALTEIAAILHLPLGTVKTRLLRALRRLRVLLEPSQTEEAAHA